LLFLGLGGQDVDRHDGHALLLVQLFHGRLDLDLVGVVVDGERVLAARRRVDRLLADHGAQDDLGRGQGGHAYTSCMRARARRSISTRSALIRSTTLSESARMISTVGRLRAESSRFWSRTGATTAPRPRRQREDTR